MIKMLIPDNSGRYVIIEKGPGGRDIARIVDITELVKRKQRLSESVSSNTAEIKSLDDIIKAVK